MAIGVIARLTFREAVRRKIVLAALLLGLAFLALYGVGLYFIQRNSTFDSGTVALERLMRNQAYNFLAQAGLYAVNFLTIAMAALISADTLAGEISSGTIQTLVTKPVRRAEIVLGKWLGFAGLIALYLLFMAGGVLGLIYLLTGYSLPNLPAGAGLVYLEGLLIMTVTLACSTTFSTLATGGVIFGLYGLAFIGGWVEQIGVLFKNQATLNIGIFSSLLMPSEALFRRASFEMTPAAVQALGMTFGPVFTTSVPSPLMIGYAVVYLAAMLALAIRQFAKRDL